MKVVLDIRSHSHTLPEGCFAFFDRHVEEMNIHATRTSETTFSVTVDAQKFEQWGSTDILYTSHWAASNFLIAINLATVGYFSWEVAPTLRPAYRLHSSSSQDQNNQFTIFQQASITFPEIRELTERDIKQTLIMFGALSLDKDSNSRIEYLKGLLHIGSSHVDITFYREAFSNFYRCLEGFVTRHVLGEKQLKNEVRDIQRALRKLGAEEPLIEAFKDIYAIRSTQVAHAQKQQQPITFDQVISIKAMSDLVMCKTYRKQAEEWRSSREA